MPGDLLLGRLGSIFRRFSEVEGFPGTLQKCGNSDVLGYIGLLEAFLE